MAIGKGDVLRLEGKNGRFAGNCPPPHCRREHKFEPIERKRGDTGGNRACYWNVMKKKSGVQWRCKEKKKLAEKTRRKPENRKEIHSLEGFTGGGER